MLPCDVVIIMPILCISIFQHVFIHSENERMSFVYEGLDCWEPKYKCGDSCFTQYHNIFISEYRLEHLITIGLVNGFKKLSGFLFQLWMVVTDDSSLHL